MCFGIFGRLCHWGPLTALGIVKCVTAMTIHCSSMWWPPERSIGGVINMVSFMSLAGLALYNFLSSIFHGPGYLPFKWKPISDEDRPYLQWCLVCEGFKAPRSHHCRKCGRCVLKMDHHCPWINNCVGWGNHGHFTAFLSFSVLSALQAAVILSCSLYKAIYRVWYLYYRPEEEAIVYLGIYGLVFCVFALGLAVGVVLAVGMLLFFQIRAIVRNRTGIEDWIMEKAQNRRRHGGESFVFPYDLGTQRNIGQVVNLSCVPVGDGITWPVVEGCDQYTLTREQQQQKDEKRQRTRLYKIIRASSGYWLPIMQGLQVCLHPPCTDEPRIALSVGDTVLVTRWRKYWLFGEKAQPEGSSPNTIRVRGWFPRQCATELTEDSLAGDQSRDNKKLN